MKYFELILWFVLQAIVYPSIALTFFSSVLTPRVRKFVPFIPPLLISFVGNILLSKELIPNTAFSLVYNLSLIVGCFVFYKEKPQQKLLRILIHYVIGFALDYACFLFALSFTETLSKNVAMVALCVTNALSLTLAAKYLNRRVSGEINKKATVFLLVPLSHLITYMAISYYESTGIPYNGPISSDIHNKASFSILLMACFVFSLVIDIFVFRHYIKSLDAAKLKAENEALEYRNRMNEQYFESLKDTELEFRKIRHDIGGSLQVVKELIYEEKKVEDAEKLFDSLSESVQNIHSGFYCPNSLVNAILVSKEKQCKKDGIPFEASVQLPTEVQINESDFCRILVNLLDNAIEGNLAVTENRFLRIAIKTDENTIFIKTENPSGGQSMKGTTKKNKAEHGYGLRILRDYAEQYGGNFSIDTKNQTVLSLISLTFPS